MQVTDLYNKFATCKIISKKKLEDLGLTEYLMKKYAGKETASQYRELNNAGLIAELSTRLEDKAMSVIDQVKFEKEYLTVCCICESKSKSMFLCRDRL
mgnify:CR=1 FL=1